MCWIKDMKICLICELNSQVILMFISDKIYMLLWLSPEFASRWNVNQKAWILGLSNEVPTCVFICHIYVGRREHDKGINCTGKTEHLYFDRLHFARFFFHS